MAATRVGALTHFCPEGQTLHWPMWLKSQAPCADAVWGIVNKDKQTMVVRMVVRYLNFVLMTKTREFVEFGCR